MATMQIAGTESDETLTTTESSLPLVTTFTTESYPTQNWIGDQLLDNGKIVEYQGENPIINPSAMLEGQLYPMLLYGEKVWVIKEPNGDAKFLPPRGVGAKIYGPNSIYRAYAQGMRLASKSQV